METNTKHYLKLWKLMDQMTESQKSLLAHWMSGYFALGVNEVVIEEAEKIMEVVK